MSNITDENTCPRCLGGIPSDANKGEYLGALSRVDNETYICSGCGSDEAAFNFSHEGKLPPLDRPVWA